MLPLVECVMNFSEGRDLSVVDAISDALQARGAVRVLHRHSDAAHHRSVITLAGSPLGVVEAVVRGTAKAAELIDLRAHRGEHPRLGATDVVPFVPLHGVTLDECVGLARLAGRTIASELGIPVYLYGAAASIPERRNLADVRRGGFERLEREIGTDPSLAPDFGERRIHPSAGATIVGARELLIAYNVYLESRDVSVARDIARSIRFSSGGLPEVKALGLQIAGRGQVQVSMNLTDYRVTPLWKVYEAVAREAAHRGVKLAGSEIVGLAPRAALRDLPDHMLGLVEPASDLVLEDHLVQAGVAPIQEMTLGRFFDSLAGTYPVPSAGSAAAAAVAAAASAASRIVRGLPPLAVPKGDRARVERTLSEVACRAAKAIEVDAGAYLALLERSGSEASDPKNPARVAALDSVLQIAASALELIRILTPVILSADPPHSLDARAVAALASGGARAALLIGRLNLAPSIPETAAAALELERMWEEVDRLDKEIGQEPNRLRSIQG